MRPRIMLATLCLNEAEWLSRLFEQHMHWPGMVAWVFVEASDVVYRDANPDMVSKEGLSVDGTSGGLGLLARSDERVHYHPVGTVGDGGSQGKCVARNVYLEVADMIQPDWIVVIDADEFYTRDHQALTTRLLSGWCDHDAVLFRQRHIWRPEAIMDRGLLDFEVVGGYWNVRHCRVWKWHPGMRHTTNHNHPHNSDNRSLAGDMIYLDGPECVHMAFASSLATRAAKARYYVHRGEGLDDGRQMYVDCRAAFETWRPHQALPHGARVIKYTGPRPEVLDAT